MLPQKHRLKRERDFKKIYRQGNRARGFFFDLTYLVTQKIPRFGIVITTKTANKATKRNELKRLVRVMVKNNSSLWPDGADTILKIKKRIGKNELPQAEREMRSFFKKVTEDVKKDN